MTIVRCTFMNNMAVLSGGALFLSGIKALTMNKTNFKSNYATITAGDMFAEMSAGLFSLSEVNVENLKSPNSFNLQYVKIKANQLRIKSKLKVTHSVFRRRKRNCLSAA